MEPRQVALLKQQTAEHPASLLSQLNAFISTSERKSVDLLKENVRIGRELEKSKSLVDQLNNEILNLKVTCKNLEQTQNSLKEESEKKCSKMAKIKEYHLLGIKLLEEDELGVEKSLSVISSNVSSTNGKHCHLSLETLNITQLLEQMTKFEDNVRTMMTQISNFENALEISLVNQGQINTDYETIIARIRNAENIGGKFPQDENSDEDENEMPNISTEVYFKNPYYDEEEDSIEDEEENDDSIEPYNDVNCFESVSGVFLRKVESFEENDDCTEYIRRGSDSTESTELSAADNASYDHDVDAHQSLNAYPILRILEEDSGELENKNNKNVLRVTQLAKDAGTKEYFIGEQENSDDEIQIIAELPKEKELAGGKKSSRWTSGDTQLQNPCGSGANPGPSTSKTVALGQNLNSIKHLRKAQLDMNNSINEANADDLNNIDYEEYEARSHAEADQRAGDEDVQEIFVAKPQPPPSKPSVSSENICNNSKIKASVSSKTRVVNKKCASTETKSSSTPLTTARPTMPFGGVKIKTEHRLDGFHDRMWTCYCGHKTRSKSGILNHIKKSRPDEKKWRCTEKNCQDYFHHVHLVTQHLQRKHDSYVMRLYGCYECYKIFETRVEQREHLNKKNEKCYKGSRVNRRGKQLWTPAATPRKKRRQVEPESDADDSELCAAYPSIRIRI